MQHRNIICNHHQMQRYSSVYGCFFFLIFITYTSMAFAIERVGALANLNIEELMTIEVSSLTRKSQRIFDTPSAVFIITQEDIRRSGVTTLPDLLRLVPGFEVGQIRSNAWAITARGFNDLYANKLLVLIDGRSVYTHLFSGVEWHLQDVLIEDIDRIEVIRGPGGSLWGANAVDGIVNIITKNAVDTLGRLITAGFGNEEKFFTGARVGWKQGIDTDCRLYAKFFEKDGLTRRHPDNSKDEWQSIRGGFRIDGMLSMNDTYTFQGDIYSGESDQPAATMTFLEASPFTIAKSTEFFKGWNLLTRWDHEFSPNSDMKIQLYSNYSEREMIFVDVFPNKWEINTFKKVKTQTIDADFQHRFQWIPKNEIIWGAGARYITDHFIHDENSMNFIDKDKDDQWLFSLFLQDQITLLKNQSWLTIGSKFEHNNYTGWEIQPSAKFLYKITDRQAGWLSISKAVRTPSRYEHDINSLVVMMQPPEKDSPHSIGVIVSAKGNPNLKSETLLSYEAGYRFYPLKSMSVDIATYYNQYKDLTIYALHSSKLILDNHMKSAMMIVNQLQNGANADTYGIEISSNWDPFRWLKFRASYSYLYITSSETEKYDSDSKKQSDPSNQFVLRTMVDFPNDIEFDATIRYVDDIPAYDIDAYTELDIRIGWRLTKNIELSIVGRNLLHSSHVEYIDSLQEGIRSELDRSIYGKISWQF